MSSSLSTFSSFRWTPKPLGSIRMLRDGYIYNHLLKSSTWFCSWSTCYISVEVPSTLLPIGADIFSPQSWRLWLISIGFDQTWALWWSLYVLDIWCVVFPMLWPFHCIQKPLGSIIQLEKEREEVCILYSQSQQIVITVYCVLAGKLLCSLIQQEHYI